MSKGDFKEASKTVATQGQTFVSVLKAMQPQIAAALPKHMNADRVSRLVLTEFRKNAKLGECTPQSVGGAIIMLSQMGLEIGVMGQGYLVPYWNNRANRLECQGIPGWQGIVDLIARSGRATAWTGAVYHGDFFEYQLGDRPEIKHRPGDTHGEGPMLYAYAVGRVNGADWPVIDVWSSARLEAHRDRFNKVGKSHYSYGNWEMYGRKVPLLQVAKYMPKSVELQQALEMEGAAEKGVTIDLDAATTGDWDNTPPSNDQPQTGQQDPPAAKDPQPEPEKPARKGAAKTAAKPAETPQAEPQSDEPFGVDEIMGSISEAKTVNDCDMIADIIRSVSDQKNREMLETMLSNKRKRVAPAPNAAAGPSME